MKDRIPAFKDTYDPVQRVTLPLPSSFPGTLLETLYGLCATQSCFHVVRCCTSLVACVDFATSWQARADGQQSGLVTVCCKASQSWNSQKIQSNQSKGHKTMLTHPFSTAALFKLPLYSTALLRNKVVEKVNQSAACCDPYTPDLCLSQPIKRLKTRALPVWDAADRMSPFRGIAWVSSPESLQHVPKSAHSGNQLSPTPAPCK